MPRVNLSATIIFLTVTSLFFSIPVSAHNIPLRGAKATVHDYAIRVLDDKKNPYVRFHLNCANAFTGHNHFVRCTVKYYNDWKSEAPIACKESIEVYFQPHKFLRSENYNYYTRHTSRPCGDVTLV